MHLVESHRIDRHDARFAAIGAACASKHLDNAALSLTRQAFIHQSRVIPYEELAREMKTSAEYRALPAKVAQWALRQVALAWTSSCAACAAWEEDPSRFLGRPKLPKYLDKRGRNLPAPQAAITANPPLATQVAHIAEQIDTLNGAVNLMREHLAALLALPGQVVGIAGQLDVTRALVKALAARQETAETQLAAVDARTHCLTQAHTRADRRSARRCVRYNGRWLTLLDTLGIISRAFVYSPHSAAIRNHLVEFLVG